MRATLLCSANVPGTCQNVQECANGGAWRDPQGHLLFRKPVSLTGHVQRCPECNAAPNGMSPARFSRSSVKNTNKTIRKPSMHERAPMRIFLQSDFALSEANSSTQFTMAMKEGSTGGSHMTVGRPVNNTYLNNPPPPGSTREIIKQGSWLGQLDRNGNWTGPFVKYTTSLYCMK